jgi:hypothetical protein
VVHALLERNEALPLDRLYADAHLLPSRLDRAVLNLRAKGIVQIDSAGGLLATPALLRLDQIGLIGV